MTFDFFFHFSLFDFLILLIRRRCHTVSRLLTLSFRGDCGHLKASWNNHINCLSGFSCSRYSTCLVCEKWIGSIWKLADTRRLYCSRRSAMTKAKTSSKKKKEFSSDLSEDISLKDNGITAPHGFTAGGRPRYGGGSKNWHTIQSVIPPGTGH